MRSYSGDTFIILSRARGWWVVQRDPTGSGVVDTDVVKQGWVPAGCLLETNVPVASAIAEATAAAHKAVASSNGGSSPDTPIAKTPILPLSIISTSFPGIALMDYKKKGEEELDLNKDDALRVFKRYNHWSYVRCHFLFLGSAFVFQTLDNCSFRRRSKKTAVIVAGCPRGSSAKSPQLPHLPHQRHRARASRRFRDRLRTTIPQIQVRRKSRL